MINSDQWVITLLVVFIIIHITVWIAGYFAHRLFYLFALLNTAAAIVIIGYWTIHEFSISKPIFERREILVLTLEAMVAAGSIYTIVNHSVANGFKIAQYFIFGVHLTVLAAALIFMLTSKIARLF
ncbi:MAG: hypothetical protein ABIN25_05720 [Ginsengibacter sp.]